jgi:hypothetical protein
MSFFILFSFGFGLPRVPSRQAGYKMNTPALSS